MMHPVDHQQDMMLAVFETAALAAGQEIMAVYARGLEVAWKSDSSPVTEADERAETIILDHLHRAFPDIPVIAEESASAGILPEIGDAPFFLVDPLDGTKEFITKSLEFTVNIAFIREQTPVAGIVYAPALGFAYIGANGRAEKLGIGPDYSVTYRTPIEARLPGTSSVGVCSRSHDCAETQGFLTQHAIVETAYVGSSLKFGLLAEGKADIYPRLSRTMEWDTAAGDAVLRAAGGITVDLDGHPLRYGRAPVAEQPMFSNSKFVARGKSA